MAGTVLADVTALLEAAPPGEYLVVERTDWSLLLRITEGVGDRVTEALGVHATTQTAAVDGASSSSQKLTANAPTTPAQMRTPKRPGS